MFKREVYAKQDETEQNFMLLSYEFTDLDFQFATMDVDKNAVTSDLRQFFTTNPREPQL